MSGPRIPAEETEFLSDKRVFLCLLERHLDRYETVVLSQHSSERAPRQRRFIRAATQADCSGAEELLHFVAGSAFPDPYGTVARRILVE